MPHGKGRGNIKAQKYRQYERRKKRLSVSAPLTQPLPEMPKGLNGLPNGQWEYWENETHHGYSWKGTIPTPYDLKPPLKDIPKRDDAWLNKLKKIGVEPLTE